MPSNPIERFDPLFRELVRYGLIERETGEGASWSLSDVGRARLDELLGDGGTTVLPEKLVYLSHHCAECHTRALTRLRDGRYLCDACISSLPPEAEQAAPSATAS
ncbi:MAG: hypothetical protein ACRDV4_10830 [Acidimicrobiales bacterium]